MKKQTVVQLHNGLLCSKKKKNYDTCNILEEPQNTMLNKSNQTQKRSDCIVSFT